MVHKYKIYLKSACSNTRIEMFSFWEKSEARDCLQNLRYLYLHNIIKFFTEKPILCLYEKMESPCIYYQEIERIELKRKNE